jgi:mxaA protein
MKRAVDRVARVFAFVALCTTGLAASQPSSQPQSPKARQPPPNAVVAQARAFGYVLGDVVTQRVLLEENGHAFTPAVLPQPGPLGIWLERRGTRVGRDARGRQWLAVEYQIMNSPQALTVVSVPAWTLISSTGDPPLRVGEWPISVAPLTPSKPFANAGLGTLRPDRAAPLVGIAPMQRWLAIWIGAFVVSLLAWAAWWAWRNWRATSSQPFAVALREMRGVDETAPQAWHALHRAFDRTAGQVVQAGALAPLFKRAPYLESLRSPIEAFFAASAARFFGVRSALASPEPSLHALCGELRRIEKRHES